MMRFDLHMHTSRYSPDSIIDPFHLVERAKVVGLDGVVLTEHDRLWPEQELENLRRHVPGLIVLGGVEVTGREGDMLCYGVTSLKNLRKGVPWAELIPEVHRQGGVCVAAHPYRWSQEFDEIYADLEEKIDGLERMSNNMTKEWRESASQFHLKNPYLMGLGNSDAHEPEIVGYCSTVFTQPVKTMPDLIAAIKAAAGRPEPWVERTAKV